MNKKSLFFIIAFTLLIFQLKAQNMLPHNRSFPLPSKFHSKVVGSSFLGKTAVCSTDTIEYGLLKASGTRGLLINSLGAQAAFQWYPVTQSMTVSGFNFFSFLSNTSGILSQNVTVSLYNAGSDSMPLGLPLRSLTMSIDSTTGNGSLAALKKRAMFSSPVTLSSGNGYVLAIENTSSNNIVVITNDWSFNDGNSEWCSSAKLGTTNSRSYSLSVGGVPFDADFLFYPIVNYSITSNFNINPTCFSIGNPVNFTNTSSAINFNRFYSFRTFFGFVENNFLWNFGNGNGGNAVDTNTIYNANGTYNVSLRDTMEGYYFYCVDVNTKIISNAQVAVAGGGGNYCQGSSINLTCNTVAGATYSWTGPNGFTSNLQNPVITNANANMAGTYNVTITTSGCTSAPSSTVVSIISQPIASSNSPVCFGQAVSFNASTIAGATYNWTGPNGFTSSLQNPIRSNLTNADTGTYLLNVTITGCSFNQVSTTVQGKAIPLAPTVVSNIDACQNSTINLTASGTYFNPIYSWTGPNSYTSNSQNPSFVASNLNQAGSYIAKVSVNGCSSPGASTFLFLNAIPSAPVVSNNGALCAGQTLSLSASLIPNASYFWSGPNGFNSSLQNPTKTNVTTTDAGIYSVYVSLNGCNSATSNSNVSISLTAPIPVASSNSPVCAGATLNLNASSISGATYSWTGPGGFISNQQNPIINNVSSLNAGTYSVSASTANCGVSPTSSVTVSVISLSVVPMASNSGPVCEGSSCTLNITNINGATYSWSGPNGYISSIRNPTINAMSKSMAGIYSVTISTSQCGVINSYSTDVVLKQKPVITSVSNNAPICVLDTFQATVSGTNASNSAIYNWDGINFNGTGKSVSINGIQANNEGTYYVSVTDSGCSSSTFSFNVVVKPKPNAPTISNVPSLCVGGKLDLVASTIANASYNWSGPNNFSSTTRNPSITNITKLAEGNYKVFCSINGCKSVEESVDVVINPKPDAPVITNIPIVCAGENVNLTTPLVQNATYSWTGPNNFTSSNQNLNLTSVITSQSGNYNCKITVLNCASDLGSTTLTVNPIPVSPSLSSFPVGKVCSGDSLQLFATFTDLATYSWTGPAGFVSNLRNPVIKNINQASTGTFTVVITKNNCTSLPVNIGINVNPTPITGNINGLTNVTKLDTNSYMVSGISGSSFDWTISNANILSGAGSSKIQVKWLNSGTATVKVIETSNQGCVGLEKSINVNVVPGVVVNTIIRDQFFSLYPNPVNDVLNIVLENSKLKNAIIYDLLGNEMLSTDNTEVHTSFLKSGVYLIKVVNNHGNQQIVKFIKE